MRRSKTGIGGEKVGNASDEALQNQHQRRLNNKREQKAKKNHVKPLTKAQENFIQVGAIITGAVAVALFVAKVSGCFQEK